MKVTVAVVLAVEVSMLGGCVSKLRVFRAGVGGDVASMVVL